MRLRRSCGRFPRSGRAVKQAAITIENKKATGVELWPDHESARWKSFRLEEQ
jgi:hypothetical protein